MEKRVQSRPKRRHFLEVAERVVNKPMLKENELLDRWLLQAERRAENHQYGGRRVTEEYGVRYPPLSHSQLLAHVRAEAIEDRNSALTEEGSEVKLQHNGKHALDRRHLDEVEEETECCDDGEEDFESQELVDSPDIRFHSIGRSVPIVGLL
ncbi:hypothetical protein CONLIGDRAFT_649021 [Coniochaeta ligniaria NRRL 30616]|uniref:Uncharacterized protein n=1 Tax=Coniochaeta ligniaria NRRL 30616 TaxID=1408157 RepID=A0A1J7I9E0_9PEZI|nr:hypothetical protein CONLIGDRAFT_649021 [Coniochaeta ligniaria NRRL 30616]